MVPAGSICRQWRLQVIHRSLQDVESQPKLLILMHVCPTPQTEGMGVGGLLQWHNRTHNRKEILKKC